MDTADGHTDGGGKNAAYRNTAGSIANKNRTAGKIADAAIDAHAGAYAVARGQKDAIQYVTEYDD